MNSSKKPRRGRPRVIEVRPAGDNHQVVSAVGGSGVYRRKPCGGCPWRCDQAGSFPAEAFKHSAATAYDMSDRVFSCHESGLNKPAICAGFLLRGSDHSLAIRLKRMQGVIAEDVFDGGTKLFENYRQMAVANGVDSADPVLASCRD